MDSDRSESTTSSEQLDVKPASAEDLRPGSAAPVSDAQRVEVSAATITRMMGIPSISDLKLLEGRVDLLTAKVTGAISKLDRILSMFGSVPTASDIDRLEIQIGTLKSLIKDALEELSAVGASRAVGKDKVTAHEQSKKLRESIRSSSEQE